ncbi:hypothetical protein BaRGS_00029269 [Batillaria attramentaria]|uniref:Uncharacterized protein n=1 Tax=Batillaria attramentaria TaxID=370345 RepID=A0ABD0JX44_9CAEN
MHWIIRATRRPESRDLHKMLGSYMSLLCTEEMTHRITETVNDKGASFLSLRHAQISRQAAETEMSLWFMCIPVSFILSLIAVAGTLQSSKENAGYSFAGGLS